MPRILIPVILLLALGLIGYFLLFRGSSTPQKSELVGAVKRGNFSIHVVATGELQAKRSLKIRGPQGMRSAQIYQTTIRDMVAEGTVVQEGEYVASLDQTELETRLKDAMAEIEKIETQLEQARIDTAIELRGIRDQLINLKFGMEEKRLQVEQSRYEPQMVIQQAEIDLERSERDYDQLVKRYELTQQKSEARISEIMASLRQNQLRRQQLVKLAGEFTIKAPKDGMVIYSRSWDGKVGPGSQISTWDPVVAELPDLSEMISKTYVNEVEISKVTKGQEVKIGVDAFPDKSYSGLVVQVANIGEQLRGYDAKVFEVIVQVSETDSILRPAMTTSNTILTHIYEDVLFVPLEAIQSDTISYVFKRAAGKWTRQEVLLGESNNNEVIIMLGLDESDEVLLTLPEDPGSYPLELLPADEKIALRKNLKELQGKRNAEARNRAKEMGEQNIQLQKSGSDIIIIF